MIKRIILTALVFFLVPAYITADIEWIAYLYDGEGVDELQRVMAILWLFFSFFFGFLGPNPNS